MFVGIFLSHGLELRQKQKQDVLHRYVLSASEPGPGPECVFPKDKQRVSVILLQSQRCNLYVTNIGR